MTDYFSKSISRSGNELYYDSKEKFISDLCKELQKGKKEQSQKKMNPYWFNKRFNIKYLEEWHIQMAIYADKFIRYYGTATADDNPELVEKTFEIMPEIGEIYKANNWEMGIFYLDDATAEFRNMMEIEETLKFKY